MKKGHTFTFADSKLGSFAVEISLPEDATLEEVLNAFETYLRSAGFYLQEDEFVTIDNGDDIDFTSDQNLDKLFREVDETLDRIAKKSNVISFAKKSEEKKNEDR